MIAGFVTATEGRILVGGRDVTSDPPHKRNMGFGFQNYALFPHLTVSQNVAFGLEMRQVPKDEIARRTNAALARVKLQHLGERLPKQLSGGQQQRVALARAPVIEPDVLLLDEPLSNLDAQLRHEMKTEIRELQRSLGITTIFVTHDQDEALSVADRVVVMRAGRIEQDGSPGEVFEAPCSHFVAEFMGVTNLLRGERHEGAGCRLDSGDIIVAPATGGGGGGLALAVRPERIELHGLGDRVDGNALAAEVETATYRGLVIDYRVRTPSGVTLTVRRPAPATGGATPLPPGEKVQVSWRPEASTLVPI